MITSINAAVSEDQRRKESELDKLFPMLWQDLQQPIALILQNAVAAAGAVGPPPPPDFGAIATELLGLARAQAAILSSPEKLLAPVLAALERQSIGDEILSARARNDLMHLRGALSESPPSPAPVRRDLSVLLDFASQRMQSRMPSGRVVEIVARRAGAYGIPLKSIEMKNDEAGRERELHLTTAAGDIWVISIKGIQGIPRGH